MDRGNSVANWDLDDPYMNDDTGSSEDDVIGYECLGCGNIQENSGECDRCTGFCTEPIHN